MLKKYFKNAPIIGVLSLIVYLVTLPEKPKEQLVTGEKSTPITVIQATTKDLTVGLRTVGTIKALNRPTVSAEIASRVEKTYVDKGSQVSKGDLLLQLDKTKIKLKIATLKADINLFTAQKDQAKKVADRYKKLNKGNAISAEKLEKAETDLLVFRIKRQKAEAMLDIQKDLLKRSEVRSPIDGLVKKRWVSAGDYLKIGKPLFDLVETQDFRAVMSFPEMVADKLAIGQKVVIRYKRDQWHYEEARITDINPSINPNSRSVEVLSDFLNQGKVKSGSSFSAEVIIENKKDAVIVPSRSVVLRPAGEVVYLFEEGKAKQQLVVVGQRLDNEVEIIKGLKKGQRIVSDGAGFLTDGAAIRVKED